MEFALGQTVGHVGDRLVDYRIEASDLHHTGPTARTLVMIINWTYLMCASVRQTPLYRVTITALANLCMTSAVLKVLTTKSHIP